VLSDKEVLRWDRIQQAGTAAEKKGVKLTLRGSRALSKDKDEAGKGDEPASINTSNNTVYRSQKARSNVADGVPDSRAVGTCTSAIVTGCTSDWGSVSTRSCAGATKTSGCTNWGSTFTVQEFTWAVGTKVLFTGWCSGSTGGYVKTVQVDTYDSGVYAYTNTHTDSHQKIYYYLIYYDCES
jgi:hypothetical protein